MENDLHGDESPPPENETDVAEVSAKAFQNYIFELFEKNGVLNDLRAHLRGNIVSVLKNACDDTYGDNFPIQKHAAKRLEYTSQAVNMLIVDYLLNLNFNYTLSVFVSELPISNMANNFVQFLQKLNADIDISNVHLQECDVYGILNYLGIHVDAETAMKLIQMYKSENSPLIVCLFKLMMTECKDLKRALSSVESNATSFKNGGSPLKSKYNSRSNSPKQDSDSPKRGSRSSSPKRGRCKHLNICDVCSEKYMRLQNKYKQKKESYGYIKRQDVNDNIYGTLVASISKIERNIIDKAFKQLQSVYESEVETVKTEEEMKVKHLLAMSATILKSKENEMVESYRKKQEALESNVSEKKKFLWGLAQSLRDQHLQMSRAMRAVREEDKRLTDKEKSVKSRLIEAEKSIKERGENIKSRISEELLIITGHLEAVRKEKESLEKEKSEFQELKEAHAKMNNNEFQEDIKSRYMRIENELLMLKGFLEAKKEEHRCTVTHSTTNTEYMDQTENVFLNNEHYIGNYTAGNDEKKPGLIKFKQDQVWNDLKKRKNVNFVQPPVEGSVRSHTSVDTLITENDNDSYSEFICRLDDHNQLKILAKQQQKQIEELVSDKVRLQTALIAARRTLDFETRPLSAPARPEPFYLTLQRETASAMIRRSGGGEELLVFDRNEPRLVVPGDTLPFLGVVGGSRAGARRHLLQQWRTLRKEQSDLKETLGNILPQTSETKELERPANTGAHVVIQLPYFTTDSKTTRKISKTATSPPPPPRNREKSPSAVLREAKLRLKKLEIEAEAVEMSYLKFKKKRDQNDGTKTEKLFTNSKESKEINRNREIQHLRFLEHSGKDNLPSILTKTTTYLKQRSTLLEALRNKQNQDAHEKNTNNYVDKPLNEFRKLYTKPKTDDVVSKDTAKDISKGRPSITSADIITFYSDSDSKAQEELKSKAEEPISLKNYIETSNNMTVHKANVNDSVKKLNKEVDNHQDIPKKEKLTELEPAVTPNDLVVYVESTSQTRQLTEKERGQRKSTEMTIITIPRQTKITLKNIDEAPEDDSRRTPEVEANITKNDALEAIYNNIDVSTHDKLDHSAADDVIDMAPYYEPLSDYDISAGATSLSINDEKPATTLYNQLKKDSFWY